MSLMSFWHAQLLPCDDKRGQLQAGRHAHRLAARSRREPRRRRRGEQDHIHGASVAGFLSPGACSDVARGNAGFTMSSPMDGHQSPGRACPRQAVKGHGEKPATQNLVHGGSLASVQCKLGDTHVRHPLFLASTHVMTRETCIKLSPCS